MLEPKKVLIVTYYWPPASGPGVQRWLKFVKYLPDLGWEPIVLAPKNGSYPNIDPTLLQDIPSQVRIEKTKSIEPFLLFNILTGQAKRGNTTSVGMGDIKGNPSLVKKISAFIRANFFIPDARKGWGVFALKKAKKLIEESNIDLIVTTGPPHSSHLIGLKLKKRFDIPWIADLRDPWTNIYYNKFLPRSSRTIKKDQRLENSVLKSADLITVVSNGLSNEFKDRTNRIEILPNGFDGSDFSEDAIVSKNSKFTLSYIGNLKVNQNCANLWVAIKELKEEVTDFSEYFKLSFTGNIHSEIISSLKAFDINDIVEILPFVEHKEAIKRMTNSDSLLFLIPESANNHQIITGKIFEYLASNTPLVSIGPIEGDASEILKECGRSAMIDYSEKNQIKDRINSLYINWKSSNKTLSVSSSDHEKFSRKNLTQQLVEFFNETLNERE